MNELIKFPVADAAISELSAKFMPLKVADANDQQGLVAVHEARMTVKNLRVAVEKTRKELKADALAYGNKVDAEAKRLTALLTPIESHLEEQEAIVAREKERKRLEEEARKQAALQARMDALDACFTFANATQVAGMSDDEFAVLLGNAQQARAKKLADDAAAAAARKAEEERIAAERAELAKQKAEQEAEAARVRKEQEEKAAAERAELDKARKAQEAELKRQRDEQEARAKAIRDEQEAEQRRLESERHQLELQRAKSEAAEKARVETEQRIARDKAAAEEAERRAKAEEELRLAAIEAARVRAEALRPDREKLLKVADAIHAIDLPAVSDAAGAVQQEVMELMETCERKIREAIDRELPVSPPIAKARKAKQSALAGTT